MRDVLFFILGMVVGVLSVSFLVGISYSAAVNIGRAIGMCEGASLFAKTLGKLVIKKVTKL